MRELLWPLGTAFIIALVLTPIIRDIFHAYNVVDRPGFRKVHAYPIPRLGGLAIAVAYAIGLVRVSTDDALLWKLLPGAGVILLTGILDDFFNLPANYKLVGQVAAGAVAFWTGLRIETIAGVALPLVLSLPLTVFWLLLTTNAFNLIDGLDGLCAGMACVGSAALFVAASIQGNVALQQAALPLIGALLGFLFYNFSRATMFLGDSGALLIGFLAGCYGIMFMEHAPALDALAPLMALAVPLMDLVARRGAPFHHQPAHLFGRPGSYSPSLAGPRIDAAACGPGLAPVGLGRVCFRAAAHVFIRFPLAGMHSARVLRDGFGGYSAVAVF